MKKHIYKTKYSELPNAWSSQKRALPQGSPRPVCSPHFVSIGQAEMHSLQDLFELLSLSRAPFKTLECRATALPPAVHGPSTQPPRAYYSIII